jgi:hypothetical protein
MAVPRTTFALAVDVVVAALVAMGGDVVAGDVPSVLEGTDDDADVGRSIGRASRLLEQAAARSTATPIPIIRPRPTCPPLADQDGTAPSRSW